MKLARVLVPVVATIRSEALEGHRLLLCSLLDADGEPGPAEMIALDLVGAGPGETVVILDEGGSARQILGRRSGPVRSVIVGIVDEWASPA